MTHSESISVRPAAAIVPVSDERERIELIKRTVAKYLERLWSK